MGHVARRKRPLSSAFMFPQLKPNGSLCLTGMQTMGSHVFANDQARIATPHISDRDELSFDGLNFDDRWLRRRSLYPKTQGTHATTEKETRKERKGKGKGGDVQVRSWGFQGMRHVRVRICGHKKL